MSDALLDLDKLADRIANATVVEDWTAPGEDQYKFVRCAFRIPDRDMIVAALRSSVASKQTDYLSAVDKIIAANKDKVEQVKLRPELTGWFVGQAMKRLDGKADPEFIEILFRGRFWKAK